MTRYLLAALLLLIPATAYAQPLHNDIPDVLANCPNVVAAGASRSFTAPTTLDCLAVKGSAELTAKLRVGTLMVYPGGSFRCRKPAEIAIMNVAPVDTERYTVGILNFGTFDCEGTPKTARTRLSAELRAGQSTITMNPAPTGWLPGDEISVARTEQVSIETWSNFDNWLKPERFTIQSCSGATCTLNRPATFDHWFGRNADGTIRADMSPYVGNHTRDVKIYSEAPTGNRGHIMHTGDAQVTMRYVEVRHMGRTTVGQFTDVNRKGRYAVHSHMTGSAAKILLHGNAIIDGTKWPLTIHSSHNGTYTENVVVGGEGAGVWTEVGDERDNLIENNLVMGIGGNGARADNRCTGDGVTMGCEGEGIGLMGPMNRVRNNWVANTLNCWILWSFANGAFQPIKEFVGNEATGCLDGMEIWDMFGGGDITSFKCWNVSHVCWYGYPSAEIRLVDAVFRGDPRKMHTDFSHPYGAWYGDYGAFNMTWLRPDVQNFGIGIRGQYGVSGGPRDPWWSWPLSKVSVINGTFDNNFADLAWIQSPLAAGGGAMNYEFNLQGNRHGSRSTHHVLRQRALQPEQTGTVRVVVTDYQGDPSQDFVVWSNEAAPSNAATRSKIADKVTGATSQPNLDPDGDGVLNDGTDKCPTVKGNHPSGCLVIVTDPIGQVTTSAVTCPASPTTTSDGQVYACSSVESPNWDTTRWGTDTHPFNVVVKPGTGPLPVTLVLHGANATSPGTFVNSNAPGIYIHPLDRDPNQQTGKSSSRWTGYKDAAGLFQPVTAERVIRYVQWVLKETTRWTADPNKVYVLGGSMGGGGAQKLALWYPDLFAAGVAATGWIDLAAWNASGNECQAGVKWRTVDGPDCVLMHDSVHLVNTLTGRKVPLFLTWNSNDGTVSPARYPELVAALEARSHPYRSQWQTNDHQFFLIPGDPQLAVRLDTPISVTTPSGSATSAATGERTNMGAGTPPPPDADGDGVPDSSDKCPGTPAGTPVDATGCPVQTNPPPAFILEKTGASRDMAQPQRVTCPNAPPCDGPGDPEFKITFPSPVTLTRLQLTAPDGGWDTNPPNWLLAVTASAATGLLNPNGATLNATGTVFYFYAAEGGIPRFPSGATVTVTATTAGGSVTQSMVVGGGDPPPPPPDADADKVPDSLDKCPNTPFGLPVDADGCADVQKDSDQDGVNDANDKCPGTAPGVKVGADGCALEPSNPCVTDPLTVTRIAWPGDNTGRRSLTFDVGTKRWTTFTFTWPGTLTVTDTRGCTATVKR